MTDASAAALLRRYLALPDAARPLLVADAFERRANRHAFQLILGAEWRCGSWLGACTPPALARMAAWFRYADFRDVILPWVAERCGPQRLPRRFTLWRGGPGPAEALAHGLSWTLRREMAALFAEVRAVQTGRPPALLRREASRAEALAYFLAPDQEVVIEPSPDWAAVPVTEAELERETEPLWAGLRAAVARTLASSSASASPA